MRGRVLIAVGLLVVVGAAVAGAKVGDLSIGPAWVLGITATLGLVSTAFSDVLLESWKEQLRSPAKRQRILTANCLVDAGNRLPQVGGLSDPLALGVRLPSPEVVEDRAAVQELTAVQHPSYVERDVDVTLRQAVRRGGLVVLEGPPRSGKSRTAYEAMRSLPYRRTVVAPRSPQALLAVIDGAFPLRGSVIWLDRLDEFLMDGGPDRAALHRLLAADPRRLLVIASLDSAAHRSTTPDAHRLSMILLRATIVRLSAQWSRAELQRALLQAGSDPVLRRALEAAAAAGTPEQVIAQLAGALPNDRDEAGSDGPAWPHTLPTAVPCIGRTAYVASLVAALLAGGVRPVPVLGGPGIGKTTIIRSGVHDEAVAERFGSRRSFVRCDGIADADGVVLEIAAAVGVAIGPRLLPAVRAELASAPALVVLDNIGPTWEADPRGVEELLTVLTEVGTVAVVVSLRGTTMPVGPDWGTPLDVRRLDHASAREVFLHYTGGAHRDDPYLDEIVAGQDGVPLGVRLMAHAAQGEPNLGGLWRRWAGRESSSPVDDGYARMDDCIAVSVESNRMNAAALRLLSMLGRLPDGVARDDLDALLPGIGDFASSDLRKVGLAFEDQGRLRTMRPIREYAARVHPLDDEDEAALIIHYSSLAARLGALVGTAEGARASARLVAEAGNVEPALAAGLKRDDPVPAIRGVFGLAEFMRYTGLSRSTLLAEAADAARQRDLSELEAECRYRLGDLALRQCRLDEAADHLQQALELFTAAGSPEGAAKSIKHLGDVAFEQSRLDVAAEHFSRAEIEYGEVGDSLGKANCVKCLGDVAARQGNVKLARSNYFRALADFEESDSLIGRADCLRRLADVDFTVGEYDAADAGYDKASLLYESSGAVLGQANCLLGRARIAAARERFADALDLATRSQILYERMAYTRGEAACVTLLGEVALRIGGRDDAREHLAVARALYQGIADKSGEAAVCEILAEAVDDSREAQQYARSAVELYRDIGDDQGAARAAALANRASAATD